MRKMDKEIIEHIVAQLNAHEESYSDGAWERFSSADKKRRRVIVYWPLWTAAALILLTAGIFFGLYHDGEKTDFVVHKPISSIEKPIVQDKTGTQGIDKPVKKLNDQILSLSPKTSVEQNNLLNQEDIQNLKAPQFVSVSNTEEGITTFNNYNTLENRIINNSLIKGSMERNFNIVTEKKKPVAKTSFEELLAYDSRINEQQQTAKQAKDSRWSPGVYVASAMGNDNKVNMNYGFSLSYAIANKLSISSGVAYTALSTTEVLDASAPQTFSGRSLESIDSRVRGINIPLELKYNISDKLYTGIGVSALAVLNNKQQNNYVGNQLESVAFTNSAGVADMKTLIVKERTTEAQSAATLDPDKYIGFYNFSLGYKQKISAKKNIAIEPFLRLPMKTFTKENLNLTNGGLRLKIDF